MFWTRRARLIVKGEARNQAAISTAAAIAKIHTPSQELLFTPANMWFRFDRATVMNTNVPWTRMKNTNHKSPKKWTVLARCRLNGRPSQPSLFAIAGLCIKPVPI